MLNINNAQSTRFTHFRVNYAEVVSVGFLKIVTKFHNILLLYAW